MMRRTGITVLALGGILGWACQAMAQTSDRRSDKFRKEFIEKFQ